MPRSGSKPIFSVYHVLVKLKFEEKRDSWTLSTKKDVDGLQKIKFLKRNPKIDGVVHGGLWLRLTFTNEAQALAFIDSNIEGVEEAALVELIQKTPNSADCTSCTSDNSMGKDSRSDSVGSRSHSASETKRKMVKATKFHQTSLEGPNEIVTLLCHHIRFLIASKQRQTAQEAMSTGEKAEIQHLNSVLLRFSRMGGHDLQSMPLTIHEQKNLIESYNTHVMTISRARGASIAQIFANSASEAVISSASAITSSKSSLEPIGRASTPETAPPPGRPRKCSQVERPSVIGIWANQNGTTPQAPHSAPNTPLSARTEGSHRGKTQNYDSFCFSDDASCSVSTPRLSVTSMDQDDDDRELIRKKQLISFSVPSIQSPLQASPSKTTKHSVMRSDSEPAVAAAIKPHTMPALQEEHKTLLNTEPIKSPRRYPSRNTSKSHGTTGKVPDQDPRENTVAKHDAIYKTIRRRQFGPVIEPLSPDMAVYVPDHHQFSFDNDESDIELQPTPEMTTSLSSVSMTSSSSETLSSDLTQKTMSIEDKRISKMGIEDLSMTTINSRLLKADDPSKHEFGESLKSSELLAYMHGLAGFSYGDHFFEPGHLLSSALKLVDVDSTHLYGSKIIKFPVNLVKDADGNAQIKFRNFSLRKFAWGVYWLLFSRFVKQIIADPTIERASRSLRAEEGEKLEEPVFTASTSPTAADFSNLEYLWQENMNLLIEIVECRTIELQNGWTFNANPDLPLTLTEAQFQEEVQKYITLHIQKLNPVPVQSNRSGLTFAQLKNENIKAQEHSNAILLFLESELPKRILNINERILKIRRDIDKIAKALGLSPKQATLSYSDALAGAYYIFDDTGSTCILL